MSKSLLLALLCALLNVATVSGVGGAAAPAPNITEQLFFDITADGMEYTDLVADPRFEEQKPKFEEFVKSYVREYVECLEGYSSIARF
jgi:hypothetical protein